jgi:hypothetical protein
MKPQNKIMPSIKGMLITLALVAVGVAIIFRVAALRKVVTGATA